MKILKASTTVLGGEKPLFEKKILTLITIINLWTPN